MGRRGDVVAVIAVVRAIEKGSDYVAKRCTSTREGGVEGDAHASEAAGFSVGPPVVCQLVELLCPPMVLHSQFDSVTRERSAGGT
jgi:hypothetical protein